MFKVFPTIRLCPFIFTFYKMKTFILTIETRWDTKKHIKYNMNIAFAKGGLNGVKMQRAQYFPRTVRPEISLRSPPTLP